MCVCFSESAWRLAFSWAPHRVLGNKYGNLSMRASLLSACFCLLLGLVKYHFSINTLISNCTTGASATDCYLRWCVDLENVFLHKLPQFVQSCSYSRTVITGCENDLILENVAFPSCFIYFYFFQRESDIEFFLIYVFIFNFACEIMSNLEYVCYSAQMRPYFTLSCACGKLIRLKSF